MRRIALTLIALLPVRLMGQGTLPHTFAVAGDVSMRIWVPAGKVRVDTWDKDSIRVTGTVGKNSKFFSGGANHGAKLGVEPILPSDTTMPNADLVVTVPRMAHVWVKMTDGRVIAANTKGELEVITVTGTISVQDAEGVVSVETIDATVSLLRINGAVRARSGGGKVTLMQILGTLTVATVSGAVDLRGASLEDARLETIGGGITVRGTVAHDARLELDTHSGPITLQLDPKALPLLSLSSRTGSVKNPLGPGKASAGSVVARTFKGTINVLSGGGIEGRKANTPP